MVSKTINICIAGEVAQCPARIHDQNDNICRQQRFISGLNQAEDVQYPNAGIENVLLACKRIRSEYRREVSRAPASYVVKTRSHLGCSDWLICFHCHHYKPCRIAHGNYCGNPHLLYIPVVIAAYHYPKWGLFIAGCIGGSYLLVVLLVAGSSSMTMMEAIVRTLVVVTIGWLIAWLSFRVREREDLYQGSLTIRKQAVSWSGTQKPAGSLRK